MLPNPCKTLGFKKTMIYKIPPRANIQPVTYFLRTDLFQRAKISVHSNKEQQSVTTITDHLELKKGKQYKIAYL